MAYINKKILDEIGIEFETNFNYVNDDIINYDNKKQMHYLLNFQKTDLE